MKIIRACDVKNGEHFWVEGKEYIKADICNLDIKYVGKPNIPVVMVAWNVSKSKLMTWTFNTFDVKVDRSLTFEDLHAGDEFFFPEYPNQILVKILLEDEDKCYYVTKNDIVIGLKNPGNNQKVVKVE